jgi:sugar phosphate isomerase/epimerase
LQEENLWPKQVKLVKNHSVQIRMKIKKLSAICVALLSCASAFALNEIPEEYLTDGFALGCQAYTFHKFSAFEAIEKTAASGGKVIEFYPGQKLRPDSEVKLDHHAKNEVIDQLKGKLAQHHIKAVNYGVVGLPNNEQECRAVFEFAKKLGLRAVTSEPDPAAMDIIEKLVKEYDIAMAIHNHPKQPNNPNYKFWNPDYILSLVKDRDSRMGSCADTGHFARSGLKPVEALKKLEGRIISSHLKDVKNGADVPYGTGNSDVSAMLQELKRQNFKGNISIEYESNLDKNVPDVAQCVGYVRGWADSQK